MPNIRDLTEDEREKVWHDLSADAPGEEAHGLCGRFDRGGTDPLTGTQIDSPQERLEETVAHWQKVLRLQDWVVKVSVVRSREMALENSKGECSANLPCREAAIRLLDPVDFPPDESVPQDMEKDLVHELVHLRFWAISQEQEVDSLERTALEQGVESMAKALVHLKRNGGTV